MWKLSKSTVRLFCQKFRETNFFSYRELLYSRSFEYFSFQSFRAKQCKVSADCQKLFFESGRTQCGNYGNLLSHFFGKNFVKATSALEKLLTKLSSRNFSTVRVNFSFFNTVMVNQVIESICHSFSRRKCSAVLLRMLKSPPLFPHDLSRKFSLSKKTPNSHLENCYIMDNWTLKFFNSISDQKR